MVGQDTQAIVSTFCLLLVGCWLLMVRNGQTDSRLFTGYEVASDTSKESDDTRQLPSPHIPVVDSPASTLNLRVPVERTSQVPVAVSPTFSLSPLPSVGRSPPRDPIPPLPVNEEMDVLWREVLGYFRDRNSTQFDHDPYEYIEEFDAESVRESQTLEYVDGIYISSVSSAPKGPRNLRVCMITKDLGVSVRVRARGPVLYSPCREYPMEKVESDESSETFRSCYGFNLYIPGIYAIEANVTYVNGSGNCRNCGRVGGLVLPRSYSAVHQTLVEAEESPPVDSGLGSGSAKQWSQTQWKGAEPLYYGNRMRGTPIFVAVAADASSSREFEGAWREKKVGELVQAGRKGAVESLRGVYPLRTAQFSTSETHDVRRPLPMCRYEDVLNGQPLWAQEALITTSGGISDQTGSSVSLQQLTPEFSLGAQHGNYLYLQSKSNGTDICHLGAADVSQDMCVRRRWTNAQIVRTLQGEHIAFQGDSTLRCLYFQLGGLIDPQWHGVLGYIRSRRGSDRYELASLIPAYLECSGLRNSNTSGLACGDLVPIARTLQTFHGKLEEEFPGPEPLSPRNMWQAHHALRLALADKEYLTEMHRDDVYMCARSTEKCESGRSGWEWRRDLYEKYTAKSGKRDVERMGLSSFCCFEQPVKNIMTYRRTALPTPVEEWEPVAIVDGVRDMESALMAGLDVVDSTDADSELAELQRSAFLLKVKLRTSFSFVANLQIHEHFKWHRDATRKVYAGGLAFVCGYSDAEVRTFYDFFADEILYNTAYNSPFMKQSKDLPRGASSCWLNIPIRNRQKEYDRVGDSNASCSYYTNDRIRRANAYLKTLYQRLLPEVRMVEIGKLSESFPEGILDGTHMCIAQSVMCKESVDSIMDALFMD